MSYSYRPRAGTPLRRDRSPDPDGRDAIPRYWMIGVGIVLLAAGLLGFVDNPIVGEGALFQAGAIHNVLRLVTGVLALGIGIGLRGTSLGWSAIVFGLLYGGLLALTFVSPDLFGILEMPVNVGDQVLHAVLTVGSVATGWIAVARPAAAV